MARAERDEPPPTGPRYTSNLLGQGEAEAGLLSAWRSGRMHHAWLLAGPAGIGKATLAHRFARYVLANPDPDNASAPGKGLDLPDDHPVVRRIRALAFPDLVEIVAETSETAAGRARPVIKVDGVRAGLAALTTTSGAGGWRVVIVDAADDLNANAANALLKSLEEPPQRTLFLLVAHAPSRLLPTIRSRCRRLDLARLSDADIASIVTTGMDDPPTGDALADLMPLAAGSAGEALRLAGQGGLDLARELMALTARLPSLDTGRLHKLIARLTAPKADAEFRIFTDLLLAWLADEIRSAQTGTPGRFNRLVGAGASARRGASGMAAADLARLAAVWENLARAHGETLGLNLDRKQFLLNAFFSLEDAFRGPSGIAGAA